MGVELSKMFTSDTDMAIVYISIPPLKREVCSIQMLSLRHIPLLSLLRLCSQENSLGNRIFVCRVSHQRRSSCYLKGQIQVNSP